MSDDDIALSKYLSWLLRHEPAAVGLELDGGGWVDVAELVRAAAANGKRISAERVAEVVKRSDKQRFALSEDGLRIRAQQGHSVEVDLDYARTEPPEVLFHGTVERFLASIRADGLTKRARNHVHLSPDIETATRVGARRGRAIVLTVRAAAMAASGHVFYRTPNDVWLTDHVPPEFLEVPAAGPTAT